MAMAAHAHSALKHWKKNVFVGIQEVGEEGEATITMTKFLGMDHILHGEHNYLPHEELHSLGKIKAP